LGSELTPDDAFVAISEAIDSLASAAEPAFLAKLALVLALRLPTREDLLAAIAVARANL
jgi:hypothetical protein